jgi:hypothetical protein
MQENRTNYSFFEKDYILTNSVKCVLNVAFFEFKMIFGKEYWELELDMFMPREYLYGQSLADFNIKKPYVIQENLKPSRKNFEKCLL